MRTRVRYTREVGLGSMLTSGRLGDLAAEDKPGAHTSMDRMSDPQWDVLFLCFDTEVGSIGKD